MKGFLGFGGNRKEIENDAAREIYEDLGLEYKNQPLSEALMVQAETFEEQAATAQPAVTPAVTPTDRTIPDPAYREDAVTAQVMGDGTEPTTISDTIPAGPFLVLQLQPQDHVR